MLPLDGGPLLVDCGDVVTMAGRGPENAARTEAAVRAVLERHAIPIVLGGDDSIPIPVLRAFDGRGPLVVLQVDAHLDFRDEVDGVRDGYSSPMRRASEMAHVEHIVQVGLRGVGSARVGDLDAARAAGNLLVTAREVRARGVAWLLEQIPSDASVFVSFDLDGLDPSLVSAVSAPVPGGLSWEEASDLVAAVSRRSLAGAAFTEYRPDLDTDRIGAMVATRLIARLLGG
jgi:agmatinase